MRTAIVVSLAAAVAGCGGNTKFPGSTVALTITPDSSVTATVEQLTVSVSGADTASFAMAPSAGLATGQAQTLDYGVVASSGTLDFSVTAMAHGAPVAMGSGSVAIKSGGVASLAVSLAAVGSDMSTGPTDLGGADMAPADLNGVVIYDLLGVDLGHGPIVPSNTTVPYNPNAADLSGVVAINTTTLQLAIAAGPGNDGGTLAAPPTGVGFVVNGSFAVLTVGKWTVDKEVQVTGTRGLIVIANSVDIGNVIHVEAVGAAAGPGGSAPANGTGHGGNGGTGIFSIPPTINIPTAAGGGGAGHGSVGAIGGSAINAAPGAPGPAYGLTLTDLSGGSGGGTGGNCGPGGAGGGALQISANTTITVELGGVVNAGGGGAQANICSGGGSGGTLLFEARAITVRGVLSANGGNYTSDAIIGRGKTGSSYGTGATVDAAAIGGQPAFSLGFGGGGGAGRIALRTSGPYAADVSGASAISPSPTIDTSLP